MPIDLQPIIKAAGKAMRVKEELERMEINKRRIYELSRMLPEKGGYELIEIYEQSLEDKKEIVKVANEK